MPWRGWEKGPGQLSFGFINGGPGGGHVAMTIAGKGWAANTETGGGAGGTWTNTMSNRGPAWGASHPYFRGNIWHLGAKTTLAEIGGGGTSYNPLLALAERIWDATVGRLEKRFTRPPFSRDNFILSYALGKAARNVIDGIHDWLFDKLERMGGGGEWDGGGNLREWAHQGLILGNAFPPTPANVQKIMARAKQESGGNPNAVNNWDSNARAGHPSKGLMQIIDTTWETWRARYGSDVGPFDSNWMNPIKSVAVASRYMRGVYGYVVGATGSGYSNGGVALGPHLGLIGEKGPEMMVPLHDKRAVRLLQQVFRDTERANPDRINHEQTIVQYSDDSTPEETHRVIEKVRAEIEQLRADIVDVADHNERLVEKLLREQIKATVAAVMAAPDAGGWQEKLDRVLSEALALPEMQAQNNRRRR